MIKLAGEALTGNSLESEVKVVKRFVVVFIFKDSGN